MTLEFKEVSFQYESTRPILNRLSLTAGPSEFLLIVGQNGVGKSTLLKLTNGILKPTSGRVLVGDLDTMHHPTSRLAREICVTFQNPADQIFAPSVRREVEFGPLSLKRDDPAMLASRALELCGLSAAASHHPYDLPPAQRKLLTVASAVASGSRLLAFDEPSAGLSQLEESALETVISTIRNEGRGLIVVSHDLGLFLRYATRVLVLGEAEMLFYGAPQQLLDDERFLRRAGLKLPVPMRLARIVRSVE